VSSAWLKPFAAGAAVVSFASLATWICGSYAGAQKSMVLLYLKPEGPEPEDPAPRMDTAAMYVASIAKRCNLKSWSVSAPFVMHQAEPASLTVPYRELSDRQLNCLTSFVKPPFVSLKIKSL
jgi:hypothetical protein